MIYDLRFELSFKNIFQLENQLRFCISNKINKINIPCKGVIKKEFLNQIIEYIGEKYKDLDVIYHYSLYHQYTQNRNISYSKFLNFIKKCNTYNINEILLVSGSNKKKNFQVLDVMREFKNEKININIGNAYNPYLKNYYNLGGERNILEKKISSGLTRSIWLQFGTDIKLLEYEIDFIKKTIANNKFNRKTQNIRIFGSLLIPSKQFISRFKFRPWKGVYIADKYLNSLDDFYSFTKDLIEIYLDNNIYPVIETEFYSEEKLEEIYTLIKT